MKTLIRRSSVALLTAFFVFLFYAGASGQQTKHIGIATYSVKGLESDIEGSFKSLQDDGYVVMEISNYNAGNGTVAGYSPADYAALAESYGMDIISSHARAQFDVNDVEGTVAAWAKLFDDHKVMGCKYVIFPMNQWGSTAEEVKTGCDLMNKIGEAANERGILFGYHNHSQEFEPVPGTDQLLEDFLINNTDPDKVFFQMDVYWITQGGQDPVTYLKKYPTRFKVLHIKDDYVIGASGNIDYQAIFSQFYQNGGQDWFVEIEEQRSEEDMARMRAMMEQMRAQQEAGEGQPGAQPPQGGQAPQAGQAARPAGGFPQQDPAQQAERLQKSLDAISQSAVYLKNAAFVK